MIAIAAGQPLSGYLDTTAIVQGKAEHDFLLTLWLDFEQVPFELGGCTTSAHVLRLPAWAPQTFEFRLPMPLSPGTHDLLWLVHDDPGGAYALQGVLEKLRREGKVTFAHASGRPFDRPIAIRQFVVVGQEQGAACAPADWPVEAFRPRQSDLLNTSLLISLTGDEADPRMQKEPAIVVGSEDVLYAFVHWAPSGSARPRDTTAMLIALLDNRQVNLNEQTALRFVARADEHYRIPFQVEWPEGIGDGQVHALYVGVAFDACSEWEGYDRALAWGSTLPVFAPPVMVVPGPSWLEGSPK